MNNLPSTNPATVRHWPRRAGFTLIELLVVIAIIGILAALIAGLAGGAGEKKVIKRAETELASLKAAIESYKEVLGYYPQDNPLDTRKSPLYYELTRETIPDAFTSPAHFNVKGMANLGDKARNFLPGLKPGNHSVFDRAGNDEAKVLSFAYRGQNPLTAPDGTSINAWNYRLTDPVHNPDSFDLWVDLDIGGKKVTVGNWTP